MNENTYMIRDNLGNPIAQKMPLDIAVLLITALCNKYYKEIVGWTIIPDYVEYDDDDRTAVDILASAPTDAEILLTPDLY